MKRTKLDRNHIYRVKIKEKLDSSVTDWFGDISLTPLDNGGTMLIGAFPDQPALRGFLEMLWNLNFTVISVETIGNQTDRDFKTG